jgi:type II secretory pathway pseudopilin PulG
MDMSASVRFRHASGFLLAELIVSITVVGMIVVGLAVSMQGTARFNRYEWSRQQCIAAAQAQIDSLTATGKPLGDEEMQRLWPKVAVVVDRSAGQGQWTGLELLQVTATMQATSHPAQVRLARYVLPAVRTVAGGADL